MGRDFARLPWFTFHASAPAHLWVGTENPRDPMRPFMLVHRLHTGSERRTFGPESGAGALDAGWGGVLT